MNIEIESIKTLRRILANTDMTVLSRADSKIFEKRLEQHFTPLFGLLHEVYGTQYDFYYHVQHLVSVLLKGFKQRSGKQKKKDAHRTKNPVWFGDEKMLGMACYVDLFAGDIQKLQDKIPYLSDLGITYLHLMPLYKSPEGDSDGGYAVSDYRVVDPKLGTINDLKKLADAMADAGINLVLDFVFNHTSDEHEWAMRAKQGEVEYQNYYWMFDNKDIPNQYETHLREIFPQVRRGNFTFNTDANKWVWTTFNNFQWDVNYSNPAVFNAITDEMLFLANIGCDALRLDALAFIWKEMGTNCENQPKAHSLIQAFNRCLKIVAPAVVFKSEAIVHPDEVLKYIDKDECELSYNPLLMALIWNSVATRKTKLLTASMQKSFAISDDCKWVNYARCHDDIGWTFDDNVAANLGINSFDHRQFLNRFFTGRFEGTYATGVAFGENPVNGDCRVCGSLASLAGLEQAIRLNDPVLLNHAVARILLIHSIILSIGGVPLLYSGDELGLLNDYSYEHDSSKQHDGRWVHRIAVTDENIAQAEVKSSPFYAIAQGLKSMITQRKTRPIFGSGITTIIDSGNEHVFAYKRSDSNAPSTRLVALCNFSERQQVLFSNAVVGVGSNTANDLISGAEIDVNNNHITLAPLQVMWLLINN
ncbi:MAG: alpha-amylase family protein [Glaciecola sp.]